MSAFPSNIFASTPRWQSMLSMLVEDVKHGAPLEILELECAEVPRWIAENSKEDLRCALADALQDLEAQKDRDRISKLLAEMMGDITADRLCELRDALRSLLTDHCSFQAREAIERELS